MGTKDYEGGKKPTDHLTDITCDAPGFKLHQRAAVRTESSPPAPLAPEERRTQQEPHVFSEGVPRVGWGG